jgi:quercetin dioxygenase-like cupin family protein
MPVNLLDYPVKLLVYLEVSMPVVPSMSAVVHELHGSTFRSYVNSGTGAATLRAWQLEIPGDVVGVPHRPSREEVFLLLVGSVSATIDGTQQTVGAGDVLLVPADSELTLSSGPDGATAWVTTTVGLEAVLADGTRMSPPWAA